MLVEYAYASRITAPGQRTMAGLAGHPDVHIHTPPSPYNLLRMSRGHTASSCRSCAVHGMLACLRSPYRRYLSSEYGKAGIPSLYSNVVTRTCKETLRHVPWPLRHHRGGATQRMRRLRLLEQFWIRYTTWNRLLLRSVTSGL